MQVDVPMTLPRPLHGSLRLSHPNAHQRRPLGSGCRHAVPVPPPSVRTGDRQERRRYGTRRPVSPRFRQAEDRVSKRMPAAESRPARVPKPLMPHCANAALHFTGLSDAAKCGSHHIAIFKRGAKLVALVGIMAQPVEQFRNPHSLEYTPPHQSIASSSSRCAASVISCASCLAR